MNAEAIQSKLKNLFRTQLHLDVPDDHADLIEEGILDSLMLVTMLFQIEQEFELQIPLEDLEIDSFRTIARIVTYIQGRNTQQSETVEKTEPDSTADITVSPDDN